MKMNHHETSERASGPVFDAMFNQAAERHERGQVAEALTMFQLLSFLNPHDAGVWRALARCHDDLGEGSTAALIRAIGARIEAEVAS